MANFRKELRKELVRLYEDNTELLRIAVKDAGLDPAYIDLNHAAVVNCDKVLDAAWKHNRVTRLISEVLDQYAEPIGLKRLQRQLLLADILGKTPLPTERLFGLSRQSLDNIDELTDDVADPHNLVNLLFGLPPRAGKTHWPIFEFVALVAAETPDPVHSELKRWQEQTAIALQLTAQQTQVRMQAKPGAGHTLPVAYIALEIGRTATMPGEPYTLMIRLWDDDVPQPPLFCTLKGAYTLKQIEQIWNATFTNPNTVSKVSRRQVCLEFIVPYELLSHEFDRWPHPLKKYGETYGMLYPLVIRSWDRAQAIFYDHDRYQMWLARAEFARRDECRFDSKEYTDWLCEPHKVVHTELNKKWRQATQLACLKLAYKPTPDLARSDSADLWIGVGLPVAVWCRQMELLKLTPAALRQQMDDLFKTPISLKALPQRFVALRLQAYNAENELGAHLTLFWDDVVRRPDLQEIAPSLYPP